jgi:biopolymer transport protein ExbB
MKNELLKIFISGGYVMFPLLICSLLSMTIIIERLISLREKRIIKQQEIDKLNNLIENGFYDKALELCIANPNPLTNIIRVIIENKELPQESLRQIISDSAKLELPYIEKYLTALSTLASVSPLLGLLGTVTGMMKVFRVITTIGLGEPAALSGGIAEALITTVFGLAIAIPSLVMHNYFQNKAEVIIGRIEGVALNIVRKITLASVINKMPNLKQKISN